MQTPVGVANFQKLIEYRDPEANPYLFVDKSLFIKDILDDSAEVKLGAAFSGKHIFVKHQFQVDQVGMTI